MFIGDKEDIKNELFFKQLREEIQDEIDEHIFSEENEKRRKNGQPIIPFNLDNRTQEQKESDKRKKMQAVNTAKIACAKEFDRRDK